MGKIIIVNGKKHYVPYQVPKTKAAFDTFVIKKANERLTKKGCEGIPLCVDCLNAHPPVYNIEAVYKTIEMVVEDTIYYNFY